MNRARRTRNIKTPTELQQAVEPGSAGGWGEFVDLSALLGRSPRRSRRVCVQSLSVTCTCSATRELLRVGVEQLLDNAVRSSAHEPRPAGRAPDVVRDHSVCFDMSFAETPFGPLQRIHLDVGFPGIGISLAGAARRGEIWAGAAPEAGTTLWPTMAPDTLPQPSTKPR